MEEKLFRKIKFHEEKHVLKCDQNEWYQTNVIVNISSCDVQNHAISREKRETTTKETNEVNSSLSIMNAKAFQGENHIVGNPNWFKIIFEVFIIIYDSNPPNIVSYFNTNACEHSVSILILN